MILKLENIGMIREASVKLDGLTVIAGENDTGKSTVGKSLFCAIKADVTSRQRFFKLKTSKNETNFNQMRANSFRRMLGLVFDSEIKKQNISNISKIIIKNDSMDTIYSVEIKNSNYINFLGQNSKEYRDFLNATIIQTPIVWDLIEFFDSILRIKENSNILDDVFDNRSEIKIRYPYILWDLYIKIANDNVNGTFQSEYSSFTDKLKDLMKGEFQKERGKFYYFKHINGESIKVPLANVAMGIKTLGTLQIMCKNRYLKESSFLIFDEPENHLHPKLQLKFAELLIYMVNKLKIKILVNSHSPYMVQALRNYANKEKILNKTNFYLAESEDGVSSAIKDVNDDLNQIFRKLSQPMQEIM